MTQTIINLGTGGAALNAQNGSTGSADSNDALFLAWTGENYVYLPGVASNFLSVPDAAALDITGDIDIRVRVAMDDWTPGSTSILLGKQNEGSQRSFWMTLGTGGTITFWWSSTGSYEVALVATSTVVTGITDGTTKWVRVTLDVDNGASGRDVRFFTSADGVSWTQLGATVTTAGITSIFSSTTSVSVGQHFPIAGKIYRAQIFNGIDGTKVLDVDTSVITTGAATSFTALTGQTVTINRSTAGRKTVAVVSPVWLFGTDDYMEVADNALLDFGASDSFTVVALIRQWATPPSSSIFLSKSNGGDDGYAFFNVSTTAAVRTLIDLTGTEVSRDSAYTFGAVSAVSMVVNRTAQTMVAYTNATATASTSTSSVGSLANALPLRIGRGAGGGAAYSDMELVAVAVFRRALTAGEIATTSTYYQGRLS